MYLLSSFQILLRIKIKLISFKTSEHTDAKVDEPYCGFSYLSLFSDTIDFATWSQNITTVILHHLPTE